MLNYFLILFLSLTTFAANNKDDCQFTDLRTLNKLTSDNRNQGKISWCYAHTAADLVQFHYGAEPISAADIAINYNTRKPANIIHGIHKLTSIFKGGKPFNLEPETGFIKLALKVGFKNGFCPRSVMPDETIKKVNATGINENVDYEDAMYDILKNTTKQLKKHNLEDLKYFYEFPKLDANNLVQILLTQKKQNIFDEITNTLCDSERIHYPAAKISQYIRNKNIFKKIDEQLNNENMVAIDYGSKLLKDVKKSKKFLSDLHTSSIIGRRWNEEKNKCEYLVRNSFGNDCKKDDKDKYDPSYTCDRGNIWIPQQNLQQAILMITYLN